MDKKVIIYEEDMNLRIVYVVENIDIKTYSNNFKNSVILPISAIPTNRFYRNAWAFNDTKTAVIIDMPKARDIHRTILRQERAPRIAALDVAYIRAQEQKDTATTKEIIAQKQKLRDIPAHPAIEPAQTPDELMALTLDKLLSL
jgi:hypothetical protein